MQAALASCNHWFCHLQHCYRLRHAHAHCCTGHHKCPNRHPKPSPAQAQLHSSRHHKITTTCACNHTDILCAHSATKGGPSTTLLHSLCTVQGRSEEANTQAEQTPRKGTLLLAAILQQRQKAAALTLPGATAISCNAPLVTTNAQHSCTPCTTAYLRPACLQRSKLATDTPHGDKVASDWHCRRRPAKPHGCG